MSEARQKLAQLLSELRELSPIDPPLSPDLIEYLIASLNSYFSQSEPEPEDLARAFGLVKRGAPVVIPGGENENFRLARHIVLAAMVPADIDENGNWCGRTFEQIATVLVERGIVGPEGISADWVGKLYRRYRDRVLRQVAGELSDRTAANSS